MKMKKKNIIIAVIFIIVCFMAVSCQITGLLPVSSETEDGSAESDKPDESNENKAAESKEENEEVIVDDEAEEEISDEETEKNIEIANEDEEAEEEISGEENSEEIDSISDEEILEGTLLAFFDAVIIDDEYSYFSSGTIAMVGSEEEYKNGDKSDIYFIIKESHSSWENIEFESIIVANDKAVVEIIADRMAEGTKYIDDKVGFDFVKENGQWKIDFSF